MLEELRPDHAFVDAADVIEERFGENIKNKYSGNLAITSRHNADQLFPIVSAASIRNAKGCLILFNFVIFLSC